MCSPSEDLHYRPYHDVGRGNEEDKKENDFDPEETLLNPACQGSKVYDEDADAVESMVEDAPQQRDLTHHEAGVRVQFYDLVIYFRPPAEKHRVDDVSQEKDQYCDAAYAVEKIRPHPLTPSVHLGSSPKEIEKAYGSPPHQLGP